MPDHICAHLTVYACPPECVRAVLFVIGDQGFDVETPDGADDDTLVLGETYTAPDWAAGAAENAADVLSKLDGVAFAAWYEPDMEGLGQLWRRTPELGMRYGLCDGDGDEVFTAVAIRKALDEAEGDPLAALAEFIGTRWDAALAAYPTGEKVREPRRYEVEWDRRRGILYIDVGGPDGDDLELRDEELIDTPLDAAPNYDHPREVLAANGWVVADDWTAQTKRFAATAVYRLGDAQATTQATAQAIAQAVTQ